MMNFKYYSFIIICIFVFTNCQKENSNVKIKNNMENVTQNEWNQLSEKRIYFGHQSVGFNMMDGVDIILEKKPNVKLNIIRGSELDLFNHPVFAHDNIGSNKDPKSKIDNFYEILSNGLGAKVDIAGFKFCYVDLKKGSDVNGIFNYYKEKMSELIKKYPNVRIIHFTVPIKSLQSGVKGTIKKLIGKDIGVEDNIVRQEFNDLLLNEFEKQSIFDIAKFESTYFNGDREFVNKNGEKIYTMIPSYTNDGGHLSKKGKVFVGGELLIFLTKLSNDRGNKTH